MPLSKDRKRVEVPMTLKSYEALKLAAANANCDLSEFVRRAALEKAGLEDDMPRRGTHKRSESVESDGQ